MPGERLSYPDPPLSDGRIGLRRWREGDVECIRLAGTDPGIPKGQQSRPPSLLPGALPSSIGNGAGCRTARACPRRSLRSTATARSA